MHIYMYTYNTHMYVYIYICMEICRSIYVFIWLFMYLSAYDIPYSWNLKCGVCIRLEVCRVQSSRLRGVPMATVEEREPP